MDLRRKRILVTGGSGFLGRHVLDLLRAEGCRSIVAPNSRECDLTLQSEVFRLIDTVRPEVVVHLAGLVGGIAANRQFPGTLAYANLVMGANLIEASRRGNVQRFLLAGTICSYPKFTPVPFRESDLWRGYPEETNAPYGLAKKMLMVQLQAYAREFGMEAVNLLLVNLYGPGDDFDPATSHVIPALIRKCVEARDRGDQCVEVWGDGRCTREFLFVEDAARAIWLALNRVATPEPINIGTGKEIAIAALARRIARVAGFHGELRFDAAAPSGQPRRCLDTSKARALLGFQPSVSLDEGLRRTIAWFEANRDHLLERQPKVDKIARFAWQTLDDVARPECDRRQLGHHSVSEKDRG